MDTAHQILNHFDAWEILIIRATLLISLILFCVLHILKAVKDFKKPPRKGPRTRK